MTHFDRLKRKRLGDILVDEGLATEEAVISALQEQQRSGRLLTDILMESREVNEYQVARAIVDQCQTPFLDLKSYTVHKELFELFPRKLLHRASIVPLEKFGTQICFACQEIPSDEVANRLKEQAPGGIYIYISSAVEIRQVLRDHAPLGDADSEEGAADAATSAEDGAWKDLFDAANESILTDIDET